MDYLIKNTSKEQREEFVYQALGISLSGADYPSDVALFYANEYIEGRMELEDVQKKIIDFYQKEDDLS